MEINTFLLEDYYEKNEFKRKYMLSSSDAESWSLPEILDLATPSELKAWENQRFSYTQIQGLPELRETVATQLYPNFTRENILCFAGAEEGIFCSLLTMCTPQDHVIILTPCYQSLQEIPVFIGCEVTTINLKEESKWRIDVNAIKRALKPNTKVVVINFPHNPTGQIITSSELQELIALLAPRGIWLFSDEVNHLLGPETTQWAPSAAVTYNRAISLGVMSKAYGLPGLRIGWIACQDKIFLNQIKKTKYYTTLCNSGPSELLSLIALRNKDHILERNNRIVSHNLSLLDQFFTKQSEIFSWVRPEGGCTGFVKSLHSESVDELCDKLARQADILLLPGSVYGCPDYFRIGFGRKNFPEALTLFEHSINKTK